MRRWQRTSGSGSDIVRPDHSLATAQRSNRAFPRHSRLIPTHTKFNRQAQSLFSRLSRDSCLQTQRQTQTQRDRETERQRQRHRHRQRDVRDREREMTEREREMAATRVCDRLQIPPLPAGGILCSLLARALAFASQVYFVIAQVSVTAPVGFSTCS